MRILIEMHHPGDVHFFRNPVRFWQERKHEVRIIGRSRDVMEDLLSSIGAPSVIVSSQRHGKFPLGEWLQRNKAMYSLISSFLPDVVVSLFGVYAQSAFFRSVPNIVFTDSEHQRFAHWIAHPFADAVVTPECFYKNLGRKQVRYKGYHELSYLHPRYFSPDPNVLAEEGIKKGDFFSIIRVSAWNTLHDVGKKGFQYHDLREVAQFLSRFGEVLFSVEEKAEIPSGIPGSVIRVSPLRLHHLLAFAGIVVSEGATIASEAAVLGTPAVFVNPIRLGYLMDLSNRYGLVFQCRHGSEVLPVVRRVVKKSMREGGAVWEEKQSRIMADHIDVAQFVAEFVEWFPHSV